MADRLLCLKMELWKLSFAKTRVKKKTLYFAWAYFLLFLHSNREGLNGQSRIFEKCIALLQYELLLELAEKLPQMLMGG